MKLIFWVRTLKDLFYIDELKKLKSENLNFDFELYLSRENTKKYNSWYLTTYFKKENISKFKEFFMF